MLERQRDGVLFDLFHEVRDGSGTGVVRIVGRVERAERGAVHLHAVGAGVGPGDGGRHRLPVGP